MVQGIDQGKGRCAIKCSAVVEGRSDAHRCLVDIGDAEIDFSHREVLPRCRGVEGGWVRLKCFQATVGRTYIIIRECKNAV